MLLIGGSVALATPPAVAASQNEVVMTLLWDGTAAFSPSDPLDDGLGAHTPGLDKGPNNRVVRTFDLFAYRIDWNVNEAAATKVVLKVTLDSADPAKAAMTWNPDQTGMFAGCGVGSTISADGLTLTCVIGDVAEGSHGTIKPTVKLGMGQDGSPLTAHVVMSDTNGSVDATSTPLAAAVSEAPAGNFVKGAPKASGLVTDATGARGYVVNFPITLQNLSALSFPSKGAGQLDASAPQEFYDHFWTAPAGTTLATASQMSAAGVVGTNCGPSVAANGLLPDAPSDWTGSCASNLGSAYPVWKITIVGGSYSLTPVDAKGTIITGQIVVWLPEAGVQAAAAANDGVVAPFDNSISSDDASKAVNATTLTPIGVKGSSTAAEPSTTDNSTHFTIGGTPPPPGGSGTSSTWFSHYAQLAANYVELSYTQNGATSWSPDHAMTRSYGANFTTGSAVTPWSGNGLVSRGMPVNMQLYVSTSEPASGTTDAPIHGCLTWNADQVKLRQMPAFERLHYDNISAGFGALTSREMATPTGTLENLVIGPNTGGNYLGNAADPQIDAYSLAEMAALGLKVHIEYALDTTVNTNVLTENRENGDVKQNNNECNNAATRTWVDSKSVTPGADGLYHYNMVRVRTEGSFPWRNTIGIAKGVLGTQVPLANAGFFLNVAGVIGNDLAVNHNDKSVYLHSSRSFGAWDPAAGKPAITTCRPILSPGNLDLGNATIPGLNAAVGGDLTTLPSYLGWCGRPYSAVNENPLGTTYSSLDPGGATAPITAAMTQKRDDYDTDRVTIADVKPAVSKTNMAGVFDIVDNGGLVQFKIDMSAVGATIEALTNVVMTDTLPAQYTFVSLDSGPSTPGATCVSPAVGSTGDIVCQMSEPNPAVDTGPLPAGLPGGWADSITITVRVTGAVAIANSYAALANKATVTSSGTQPWDTATGGFVPGSSPSASVQSAASTAMSYLPLSSDKGAIIKTVAAENGPCEIYADGTTLTGAELVAWQARCSMIGFDFDSTNVPTVDAKGNMTFSLAYTNQGNTRLTGMRFVDVLPYNGDGTNEPASGSGDNGATPSTVGDARSPASNFDGQLGFVGVTGASAYYVTADAPASISRDPNNSYTLTSWCSAVGGTVVNGVGTDAGCPKTAYDVTAVYVVVTGAGEFVAPEATKTISLTLDTENADCSAVYTNTFGARIDQVLLPIRSNDVSIMVKCPLYSVGNQVWSDVNNNGVIDPGEKPIANVAMELYSDVDGDGKPDDLNGDGIITSADAIATATTNDQGLYLFSGLDAGDYLVAVAASNFATGGALANTRSSDPTETNPNADVDNNDNGIVSAGMVWSGVVTLGREAEPTGETPNNDTNADNLSNLTVDFGFYVPKFDLALRKTLATGQAALVNIGDLVTFNIEVFNQGDIPANQIQVTDYIPAQLELADTDWTAVSATMANYTIPTTLAPQTSIVVPITLRVKSGSAINNYAEISKENPLDAEGNTLTDVTGAPVPDIDSIADTDNTNDVLIDDEINKPPATGDEDDQDIASIHTPYSLGNQVWFDTNNNGIIDTGEKPIGSVAMELYTDKNGDGKPDDTNGDGVVTSADAIATTSTNTEGLYLFSGLEPGDYLVAVAASNFASGGVLQHHRSSDPTEANPNADVDNNDNGIVSGGMVWSGVVTLGNEAEPLVETPNNDTNQDNLSNLTVDFGFYVAQFDLALRKTLAAGQSDLVNIGDLVTFNIEVFNQGDVPANQIEVTDYIPSRLQLADTDWTLASPTLATYTIPTTLAPKTSIVVPITMKVLSGSAIDNHAEISKQHPLDPEGNTLTDVTGAPVPDIDSIPDQILGNDVLIDDKIDLTPATGDEDDEDIASIRTPYSLGNQVWNDVNNNGIVDAGEKPIAGVAMELYTDKNGDGNPDDTNGDGVITSADAIATTTTDANGLYLFSRLDAGDYLVAVAASNFATDGVLANTRSSDPTETDPNADGDNNDNGIVKGGIVWSGVVTLGKEAEPLGESPNNDTNQDNLSNLTVDFGFYVANFDLALRKTLAAGQSDLVNIGDLVTFDITVFNQGDVAANQVEVTDYIPRQLQLADNDWIMVSSNMAIYTIPVTLKAGESIVVPITLRVTSGGSIDNYAEISSQNPVDAQGKTLTLVTGAPVPDVDSIPDRILGNDKLIDDEINKTAATGDEDDQDIASIRTPLAKTGSDATGAVGVGVVLLLAGGGLAWLVRRRIRTTI